MDQQLIFKIWFAGFYEGEGSISNDKSNNNRFIISVSQNDRTPLDKAQSVWGGKIRKRTRISATGKICIGHEWRISYLDSLKFIEDIKPFMIIPYKIGQIEKALKKHDDGNNEKYKCNLCDKIYSSPSGRRRHEKKEHVEKGTIFKCNMVDCERTFKSKDSLNRHKRINHKN
jgi:hypothetical protein